INKGGQVERRDDSAERAGAGGSSDQMNPGKRHKATGNSKKAKVFGFALCVMLFGLCVPAKAQQTKKVYRVGFLSPLESPEYFEAFRQGMRELGYTERQNLIIDYRSAKGMPERFPDLAA